MSDKPKSVEQRLFEAIQGGRGVRLTFEEVFDLVRDDAVAVRIGNTAYADGGGDMSEHELAGDHGSIEAVLNFRGTWQQFCRAMADGEGQS